MKHITALFFVIGLLLPGSADAGILDWFQGDKKVSSSVTEAARHSSGGVIDRDPDGKYVKDTYRKFDKRVPHSSGGTIGQTVGRYVKGTFEYAEDVYTKAPPRVRNFVAKQGVKRAVTVAGTVVAGATAPAWATAATVSAVAIGTGLLAKDVYDFIWE